MSNLLNEFELFELENKAKLNTFGGRRALTSQIVVGFTGPDSNGSTTMDIQNSGDGTVMCDEPDADWGGLQPIGTEVG
jgi:hypothetical protein